MGGGVGGWFCENVKFRFRDPITQTSPYMKSSEAKLESEIKWCEFFSGIAKISARSAPAHIEIPAHLSYLSYITLSPIIIVSKLSTFWISWYFFAKTDYVHIYIYNLFYLILEGLANFWWEVQYLYLMTPKT